MFDWVKSVYSVKPFGAVGVRLKLYKNEKEKTTLGMTNGEAICTVWALSIYSKIFFIWMFLRLTYLYLELYIPGHTFCHRYPSPTGKFKVNLALFVQISGELLSWCVTCGGNSV